MNATKTLAHTNWLDELKTTPSQDFFPTLRRLLELLTKENKVKIRLLQEAGNKDQKRLAHCKDKAIQELEEFLEQIEKTLKKEGEADLILRVQGYRDIKSGKSWVMGTDLPDILYNVVRAALERLRSKGELRNFSSVATNRKGFWYVDYEKFNKKYPQYARFEDCKAEFEKRRSKEPWGAYNYLEWAVKSFKPSTPGWVRAFVRTDSISSMRTLMLYLATPTIEEKHIAPAKFIGIKGLFSLSQSPTAIYYEGVIKKGRGRIRTKGRTQPYAILKQAAEKYKRQVAKREGPPSQIKLSEVEIKNYITDSKNCDRQPKWKATILSKRRLEQLEKNIKRIVPFTNDELRVEERSQTAFLVFRPQP